MRVFGLAHVGSFSSAFLAKNGHEVIGEDHSKRKSTPGQKKLAIPS